MTAPNASHTVLISCDCSCCEANAKTIGHPFPLAAWIMPQAADMLGITAQERTRKSRTHGTVYMAHDPIVGKVQRMAIPVVTA